MQVLLCSPMSIYPILSCHAYPTTKKMFRRVFTNFDELVSKHQFLLVELKHNVDGTEDDIDANRMKLSQKIEYMRKKTLKESQDAAATPEMVLTLHTVVNPLLECVETYISTTLASVMAFVLERARARTRTMARATGAIF